MNIVILGPQGSGKGTQADKLAREFDLLVGDMGKLLREAAKTDIYVDRIVNKEGSLLPDEIPAKIVLAYLDKNLDSKPGFILDGFPRSLKQFEYLKEWLSEKKRRLDFAILLEISVKESIRRLSSRRVCEKCGTNYNLITNPPPKKGCECGGKLFQRDDDKPEAIKKRLQLYKESTKPLIKIYSDLGILFRVDGEQPIEVISKDILKHIRTKSKTQTSKSKLNKTS
ncbi:hypothetical protein A2Z22_02215 [Candidatus Woesebacteria bacterium RBG_16_34_12]|uniref:Adenylate kinase n=1 Tax=Candidatus Woesebacteria bacterium RBG_16_34_12 TaxID=1802480 RepID=A0A1F7X9Z7_9BACT|nr:MAG: hypothetical protein A2Z22_02215 [Candidatus Woesebacteria bacterium RBG_16_34_12]